MSSYGFLTRSNALLLAVGALAAAACGSDAPPLSLRNFDRPTDMAFACFGDLRVNGEVQTSAQPLSSCAGHQAGEVPDGQEGVVSPEYFGFVLQPTRGTMAVVNVAARGVQDNDPLTPGLNDIPVGALPVGMAEDSSGCFVLTANSGSCDLAAVNVTSALDLTIPAQVNRVAFSSPAGSPILTRPRAIATGVQTDVVGQACPDAAQGLVYVSYPGCQLVAAVDAGSGVVQSALAFRQDGSVDLASDADFAACPLQCGASSGNVGRGAEVDAGVPAELFDEKPVAMEVSKDGLKLYVASEGSPFLTIADLGVDGLPTGGIRRLRIQGEVGITNFAISDPIDMGGDEREGKTEMPIGEFQFAYVIATDATIRVLDIENQQECDTQVDPRYLKGEEDVEFLACMPVGDPRTPPRRAGAKGPGIQLPGRFQIASSEAFRTGLETLAVPLDVSFSTSERPEGTVASAAPDNMFGTFAFVTASSGFVFIINVDDDNYADTEEIDSKDPLATSLPLALPHQLRDNGGNRAALSTNCGSPSLSRSELGARLMDSPSQLIDTDQISAAKVHELPFLRGVSCSESETGDEVSAVISELSYAAPAAVREASYQDLRMVENQRWSLVWEGPLSGDSTSVNIDGPVVRKGTVIREAAQSFLRDGSEPFCALGVEPFDIATLLGCDPLLNDNQCGVGESCFVHPDTSSQVFSGVCLPSDRAESLADTCRDFLISRRRYTVATTAKGELELIERRRILRTSPLDGCESDTQCVAMAGTESLLRSELHPIEAIETGVSEYAWACEIDPSRVPGVDRCVMTCEDSSDCESGFHCSADRCVEAPLPPAACTPAVQRYLLSAGEAFAVLGTSSGFIHSSIADPATGECVKAADAHPLVVGRLPLRPEACDDDGDFATGPNPCTTSVEHTDSFTPYLVENGLCVAQEGETRVRSLSAVEFANPGMRFHMVDTETTSDLSCRNDQEGTGPAFASTFPGYQISFEVGGGFFPKIVPALKAALPIRIIDGPQGRMWVLDQGDVSAVTRGRLIRINPAAPGAFDVTPIL